MCIRDRTRRARARAGRLRGSRGDPPREERSCYRLGWERVSWPRRLVVDTESGWRAGGVGGDAATAVYASSTRFVRAVRIAALLRTGAVAGADDISRSRGGRRTRAGRLETGGRRRLCQPIVVTMSDTAHIC